MHDHNTQPDSLFLRLQPPASITLARADSLQEYDGLATGNVHARTGYPDSLSFPDILYDRQSRQFVGLTFHSTDWDDIRVVFVDSDDRIVEFISHSFQDRLPTPRLDVRWAFSESLAFDGAQIADVLFYFCDDPVRNRTDLVAMELNHILEILTAYDLIFPSQLLLHPHEVTWFDK